MKKTYQTRAAAAATDEVVMPESVTLAMADLAGAVEEGLLALAVGAGFAPAGPGRPPGPATGPGSRSRSGPPMWTPRICGADAAGAGWPLSR